MELKFKYFRKNVRCIISNLLKQQRTVDCIMINGHCIDYDLCLWMFSYSHIEPPSLCGNIISLESNRNARLYMPDSAAVDTRLLQLSVFSAAPIPLY